MAKDKSIFDALDDHNIDHIFVGGNSSLGLVGSRTVELEGGFFSHHFMF
jgi:hypothetical protein